MYEESLLLSKLHLISCIKEGETITTVTESIIRRDSWYRTYQRYIYGEDRVKTLEWIVDVVEISLRFLTYDYDEISPQQYERLKTKVLESTSGIEKLQKTYADDPIFQKKLRNLIETIELKLFPKKRAFSSSSSFSSLYHLDTTMKESAAKATKPIAILQKQSSPHISQSYPNFDIKNVHYSQKKETIGEEEMLD